MGRHFYQRYGRCQDVKNFSINDGFGHHLFQRRDLFLALVVSAKSSEILIHMVDIIEDRMPAEIKPATMTDADFPSPSGTFIAMDCAGIPDAREARKLESVLRSKTTNAVSTAAFSSTEATRRSFEK